MKQYMQDRFISVCGLAFVGGGFWLCTYYEADSAFFPRICLACIGFLLVLLGIESVVTERRLKATGKEALMALPMNLGPFLVVVAALVAYGAGLVILGFYSASVVFLLAVGFLWKGVKRQVILAFAICMLIFLYVCFTVLFNVPLPRGLLF